MPSQKMKAIRYDCQEHVARAFVGEEPDDAERQPDCAEDDRARAQPAELGRRTRHQGGFVQMHA